jgi:hypothetical protein
VNARTHSRELAGRELAGRELAGCLLWRTFYYLKEAEAEA